MATHTITIRLDEKIHGRIEEEAKELGLGISIYARDLIHASLVNDSGEELLALRREIAAMQEIMIRGFRSLFLTLASDTAGHKMVDVDVLFQRLLGKD